MKYTEKNILSMLMADNEKGLKQIYKEYYSLVYSFLLKECNSEETAKDLTQDVFFKLWNNRYKLNITESLKSYLFKIAQNTYIDHIRRAINQKVFDILNENLSVDEEDLDGVDEEMIEALKLLADHMPEKRKEVFYLRWIEGLSRKEISERMNISIVTVDIHIRKAIDFLREKSKNSKLINLLSLFI